MRAMQLLEYNAALVPINTDKPEATKGEVVVEVAFCGICRTDLKILQGQVNTVKLPHIMGHEISGYIDSVGTDVTNFKIGDRVVVISCTSCGDCWYCRNGFDNHCENYVRVGYERHGGYAEYVSAPARNVYKVPDNIALRDAAIITDAIATPLHALRYRAKLQAGETIFIIGVGGEGAHTLQIAKAMGAYVIAMDIDEKRLSIAKELGADEVLLSSEATEKKNMLKSLFVDCVFDTVGIDDTISLGMYVLRPMGRFVMLGYQAGRVFKIDQSDFIYRELAVLGTRGATLIDTADAINMVSRGQIKPLISREFSLAEANEALLSLKNNEYLGRAVLIP